jgi:hypothetical protein
VFLSAKVTNGPPGGAVFADARALFVVARPNAAADAAAAAAAAATPPLAPADRSRL